MTDDHNKTEEKFDPDRRKFIKNTGVFAGGIVGGSFLGGFLTNQFQSKPKEQLSNTDQAELYDARVFFDRKEDFAVLSVATERLFPKDKHGPGAIELGVPYFIDKQLNGSWGTNAHEYMEGPFPVTPYVREYEHKDVKQSKQGPNAETLPGIRGARYQSRLNRGEIFIRGLRTMERESQERFGENFEKLDGDQQDEILTAFENGDIAMPGVSSKTFFNLLFQTTIEGAYADPVYGGNKNMMGWKMIEYPGPRMAYADKIDADEFILMEPESLRDYQS